MRKYIIYIAILAAGLVLGYVFFGTSSQETQNTTNISDVSENAEEKSQMWTCSMHPQIMQPEPGDCPICGMELIPAESGDVGLAVNEIKMTKNAMALANIQTVIVGESAETDGNSIMLSGKIRPNEESNAVQASYFEGRIEKLNVNFTGEEVRKGQLLATIYAPELVAAQQELLTAASMKESQPALYKSVRNKLKLWKLSENQIDQIETAGKVRENFPIYATVSGTVSEKMVEEGDYVEQGQPILKLRNLETVWAMFDAYENQISQLSKGQKITVTTNAYPGKKFEATVSFIDPSLNTQSRTVSVRATLNNQEGILKPGMFVTSEVALSKNEENQSQITVPASAVLWTGTRSLVYIKTNPNEPIFEMREVSLGAKNGDFYTITEGLENGEEVVANGTFTVDAAAQLQGKNSMMVHKANQQVEISEEDQEIMIGFMQHYFQLKDVFVGSDAEKVSQIAKSSLNKVENLNVQFEDKTAELWQQILTEWREIAQINDDINQQRLHFKTLNESLIPLAKKITAHEETWYLQECPMADSNSGGYWISTEKGIINPYFGERMLKCGSVEEEWH